MLPTLPLDPARKEHRDACAIVLAQAKECYDTSTAEERVFFEYYLNVVTQIAPPPVDVEPPVDPPVGPPVDPPVDPPTGDEVLIGVQFPELHDFYPGRYWADLMLSAGPWRRVSGSGRELAEVNAMGAPLEPAMASVKTDGFNVYGTYRLTPATATLVGDFTVDANGDYVIGTGSVTVQASGNGRENVRLVEISANEPTDHSHELLQVAGYADTFRNMGLSRVNHGGEIHQGEIDELFNMLSSKGIPLPPDAGTKEAFLRYEYNRFEPDWGDRSREAIDTYAGRRGVPYEEQIRMAKALGSKRFWISCPAFGDATKDGLYAYNLGKFFAANWGGDVDLEGFNEVWNRGFRFDSMALQRASTIEEGTAIMQRELWTEFRAGYVSAGGNPSNLRWACMGWLYDVSYLSKVMGYLATQDPSDMPGLVGPSFYISGSKAIKRLGEEARTDPALTNVTGDILIQWLRDTAWEAFVQGLNDHAAMARTYGAVPGAYEGNISLIAGNLATSAQLGARVTKLVFEAYNSESAKVLMRDMVDECVAQGYKSINAFAVMHNEASPKDGVFGLWTPEGPRGIGQALIDAKDDLVQA